MKDACCSSGACAVDVSTIKPVPYRLSSSQKKELALLMVSLILALSGILLWELISSGKASPAPGSDFPSLLSPLPPIAGIVMLAIAYLLAGFDVLKGALKNIMKLQPFDELFLMSIASLGAFAIGAMEEAVGVMVLYRFGEWLQDVAVSRSRQSIKALLDLKAETARVLQDGQWQSIPTAQVKVGDLVQVRAGERVPVDGEVIEGSASFDTAAMTGESLPRPASVGTEALAGFIVMGGVVLIRTQRVAQDSAASRIIRLVEEAIQSKAKPELFIHRFARWYTPIVVFGALAVALIPPLLFPGQTLSVWVYRALTMLVISCPCAFVLSIPLSYFAGLGGAARKGILVKGATILDTLARTRTVVFDKTGTLTKGDFTVRTLLPAEGFSEAELLSHAATASAASNHPLSQAIQRFYQTRECQNGQYDCGPSAGHTRVSDVRYEEIPGHGSAALVQGKEILAGNDRLLHLKNIPHHCDDSSKEAEGAVVHVAVAGSYVGKIELGDTIKDDARHALETLQHLGIQHIAVLTGDHEGPARRTAEALGNIEVHHNLLPEDKLNKVDEMIRRCEGRGSLVYVGDGINDAPVLARSDAGIAMGGVGTDAAIESADVVLLTDEVSRIPQLISHARKTRHIVVENIVFALGFKVAFLALGALGIATMWEAVIADVGVALLAVLNATRALR
jgi:Cd2+/Zn2+-exporting ATPase